MVEYFPAAGTPGQFTVKSGGQIEFSDAKDLLRLMMMAMK